MKLLLVGASSYVGARLYFDVSKIHEVVGTYSTNAFLDTYISLDVTNQDDVMRAVSDIKPDIIIHAANNASAKWCDAHPKEAITLNQKSTEYMVMAADKAKAKLVYISSMSASDTSNIYGQTKAASEKIAAQAKSGYLIIRPSLVLGYSPNTTNDRPFNRILKNIDQGVKASYDTSWKFQPTYIRHISEVLLMCIGNHIWNATIPVAVDSIKSRYEVAVDILSPLGITVTPVDMHDQTTLMRDDLSALRKYGLPEYSYEDMIKNILEEIRNRGQFHRDRKAA